MDVLLDLLANKSLPVDGSTAEVKKIAQEKSLQSTLTKLGSSLRLSFRNTLSRPTKKRAKKKKDGVPISDNAVVSTPVYTAVDTSAIDTNTNTASPGRRHKNKPSTSSSTTTTTRGTKTPREGRKKKQARRVCDTSNVNKNNNLTSAVMVSRSISDHPTTSTTSVLSKDDDNTMKYDVFFE